MQPKVRARIRDLKTAIAAKLINYSVREKNTRLEALQSRWEKLNRVIEQRAVAPELQQGIAGDRGTGVTRERPVDGASRVYRQHQLDRAIERSPSAVRIRRIASALL